MSKIITCICKCLNKKNKRLNSMFKLKAMITYKNNKVKLERAKIKSKMHTFRTIIL